MDHKHTICKVIIDEPSGNKNGLAKGQN